MKKLRRLNKTNFALTVLFYITFSCQNNPQTRQIAQLETDHLTFDVGTLQKDSTHIFNFYIKSVGEIPLKIDSVSRNCVCTSVQFPKSPINKGDSAKFIVTYTPNKSDSGKFTAGFMVKANIEKYFIPVNFTGTLVQ